MAELKKSEKILLIAGAVTVAGYIFMQIGGGDTPTQPRQQPVNRPAAAQQTTAQNTQIAQNRPATRQNVLQTATDQDTASMVSLDLVWKNDPFKREIKIVETTGTEGMVYLDSLKFNGSLIKPNPAESLVLINNMPYGVNDEVNGYFTIIGIYEDHVVFKGKDNKQYTLR